MNGEYKPYISTEKNVKFTEDKFCVITSASWSK